MINKENFKIALKMTIPVFAGYVVLGLGYGIVMSTAGYEWWWSLLFSLFVYAGSMQYVSVNLLVSGANLISAALLTLMVNARHLFYGISMLDKYKGKDYQPYLAFALTDETYALLCNQDSRKYDNPKQVYFYVSLMNQSVWVTSCTLGALIGQYLPFDTTGIDFSMTALFIVIFVQQWEGNKNHSAALIGLGCSLFWLFVVGSESFLIPTMISMALLLIVFKKQVGDNNA